MKDTVADSMTGDKFAALLNSVSFPHSLFYWRRSGFMESSPILSYNACRSLAFAWPLAQDARIS